jgi:GTPase Era involved in 16S rRNA processing
VNKDSQKGILIGKGGEAIKALGIVAREKLEEVIAGTVMCAL